MPTRGLLLGEERPGDAQRVIDLAKRVESAGLDSVWVGDSLTAKPRLEPLSTLAAIASCTKKVRLGTAVLLPALRHPVLLAQTMATVDVISKGRLVVGAGVGGAFNEDQQQEWRAAGVDPGQRATRLEEIVKIVHQLGTGEAVSFDGKHFSLEGVKVEPQPVQQHGVPVLLASHWRAQQEAQIERVARLGDGLISISDSPEEYARLVHRVDAALADRGRDTERFERAFYTTVNLGLDVSKAESEATAYLMKYYGTNHWGTRWGPFGDPERVKSRLAEYVEAGAQTLVVRFASFEPEAQLETFLDRVAPEFN